MRESEVNVRYDAVESDLPLGLRKDSLTGHFSTISAIALQLAVIAIIITVLQVDIFLKNWLSQLNGIHVVYTTGITVLATAVTAYTSGVIRKLWFRRCHFTAHSSTDARNRDARVVAGLGSFTDQLRRGDIFVAFVLVALVTASLVACLSPRIVSATSASKNGRIFIGVDPTCVNDLAQRSTAGKWFYWMLENGSYLGLDQNPTEVRNYCFARKAIASQITGLGLGVALPNEAAYVLGDILVIRSAVGMPLDMNSYVDSVFGTQRSADFQWASRCLPVLTKNPVKCTPAGVVRYYDANKTISVSNGDCSIASNELRVSPSNRSAAVLGACTNNKAIGTATVLIGAVDEIVGVQGTSVELSDNGYANRLASIVNGYTAKSDRSYAVTCSVNLTSAVGFRMLNYTRSDGLQQYDPSIRSGYGHQVSAVNNDSCTIYDDTTSRAKLEVDQILGPSALANAAGSIWPLLAENMFDDGWFDTLYQLGAQAGPHFNNDRHENVSGVFLDSANGIEDALGSIIAIAMGLWWAQTGNYTTLKPASNAYRTVRLGPSDPLGYLFLLPSIFSLILIGWLSWDTWTVRRGKS